MTKLDFTNEVPQISLSELEKILALKSEDSTEIDAERQLLVLANPEKCKQPGLTGDMVFKPVYATDTLIGNEQALRTVCISARDIQKIGKTHFLDYTNIATYGSAGYGRTFYGEGEIVVPLKITNTVYSQTSYDSGMIGKVSIKGEGGSRFLVEVIGTGKTSAVDKAKFVYSPIEANIVYSPKTTVVFTPIESIDKYLKGTLHQGVRYGVGKIFSTNGDSITFTPEQVQILDSSTSDSGTSLFAFR